MRRRGRECALQLLYQMDMQGLLESDVHGDDISEAMGGFWDSFESVEDEDRTYAERLVDGVMRELPALNALIEEASHRWKLERMAQVDRNLLRIAAFEICYCPDIPRSVSINEAIEVAKRFSGTESYAFINGILDNLKPAEL